MLTESDIRKINARKARGNYIPEDFDHSSTCDETLKIQFQLETEANNRWKENKWGKRGSLLTANLEALTREMKKRGL